MTKIAVLLRPLVGRWTTTITMVRPSSQAGAVFTAVDTYRWMPQEKVLIHEVEARMEEPVFSLEIYTQDEDGNLVARSYDSSGQVNDYRASMLDGVWKVEGATERFCSSSLEPNRIEGLWQLKASEGWTDWMRVRLDRVSGAAPSIAGNTE